MADEELTLLGEYIAEIGLTQTQFAELASVPAPMVSVWSRLRTALIRRPGRKNAGRIAVATRGKVPSEYWDEIEAASRRARRSHRQRLTPRTA
jgi:hypothetical protein